MGRKSELESKLRVRHERTKLSKGQVVIPKPVREQLRWVSGTELAVEILGDGAVRLTPLEAGNPKQQNIIDGCCRQLIAQQVIEPLSTDEEETRAWNLCELASLIEGHFHVQLDVSGLSEMERLAYERRVSFDGSPLVSPHKGYRLPFWLLDEGRRVGTIAITTMLYGLDLISISSLYVDPAMRNRNIGHRALEAVYRPLWTNTFYALSRSTS